MTFCLQIHVCSCCVIIVPMFNIITNIHLLICAYFILDDLDRVKRIWYLSPMRVKVCHDGMLEDTNSLDGAHFMVGIYSHG